MLTLGFSDGSTFMPVNSVLLSTENKKNRINEAKTLDKRTIGYKRRALSMTKATAAMLELLQYAKKASIPAKHVLFDSWFTFPVTLHDVTKIGYDVIAMAKKSSKTHYRFQGKIQGVKAIFDTCKKRPGRSRYLLSVEAEAVHDGEAIPCRIVYVRNRNKRKEYRCLITTDMSIGEEEIIRLYGKRWDIEVFFKMCKSYLNLTKECRSLSYNAMTAHTAIVFTRYMMLSLEAREAQDERSLGEMFLYFSDQLADVTWITVFRELMALFEQAVLDWTELPDAKIRELLDTFVDALPLLFKSKFSAA